MLRCSTCGKEGRGLIAHRDKVSCPLCLAADEEDELCVKLKIALLRAEEIQNEAKRVRKK